MDDNFDLPRVINILIAMNQTVIMKLLLFDLGISGKVWFGSCFDSWRQTIVLPGNWIFAGQLLILLIFAMD